MKALKQTQVNKTEAFTANVKTGKQDDDVETAFAKYMRSLVVTI